MQQDPKDIRREYGQATLARSQLHDDPLVQFDLWLTAATDAGLMDATAMTLATADAQGRPSARIVLLKGFDADGFVWFTSYDSAKGTELVANPQASLLFYWRELERQVRISGSVQRLDRAASVEYFHSRPRDSQISAAASAQSQPIADREALEAKARAVADASAGGQVPVPEGWGGYVLQPDAFEFWQGRENRLHDRFSYHRQDGGWVIERLQP